jgi:hypothetical protein
MIAALLRLASSLAMTTQLRVTTLVADKTIFIETDIV